MIFLPYSCFKPLAAGIADGYVREYIVVIVSI
jgi:hypothetical protein